MPAIYTPLVVEQGVDFSQGWAVRFLAPPSTRRGLPGRRSERPAALPTCCTSSPLRSTLMVRSSSPPLLPNPRHGHGLRASMTSRSPTPMARSPCAYPRGQSRSIWRSPDELRGRGPGWADRHRDHSRRRRAAWSWHPTPAAGTYPDGTSLALIVDSTNPNGYRWAEGSAAAPAPTVTDALTTEAGDTLTTESGDILVHA